LAALERSHTFDNDEHRTSAGSLVREPDQTVALYATCSNINIRSGRETVLAELRRILHAKSSLGRVIRNMVTSLTLRDVDMSDQRFDTGFC